MLDAQGLVANARVLDLYAGTGALGLEALSRGAARATFVESARGALVALRANVAALRLEDRARVLDGEVERAHAKLATEAPFDLLLADPPYADVAGPAKKAIDELVASGRLAADGLLVLEHASRDEAPPLARLKHVRTRVYGDTTLAFYEVDSAR
jgi:16S rRNA (guanine966-N2)-methyltransferase